MHQVKTSQMSVITTEENSEVNALNFKHHAGYT